MLGLGLMALMAMTATTACGCPGSRAPGPADSSPPPPADLEVERIPMAATPASALSTEELAHTELLRIARNFGKESFQIALDAWVPTAQPDRLADVRLWWARSDRSGERSPFGEGTKSHFEIEYEQPAPDHWRVLMKSGGKTFAFDVEVGEGGVPGAFTEVDVGPRRIPHCRTSSGTLHARRLLGAPIGIRKLDVQCVDDEGTSHQGSVVPGS
jgi:hypothetical protein